MERRSEAPEPRIPDEKLDGDDERADEADRESFPASDPPSGWSGRDDPPAAAGADEEL